jgi:lipoprotein Spr
MWSLFFGIIFLSIACLPSFRSHRNNPKHIVSQREIHKYEEQLGISLPETSNIAFIKAIVPWLGSPYKYGGNSRNGTDCSGLVSSIYSSYFKIELDRTSLLIYQNARKINKSEVKEGDLVFFKTDGKKVSHIGIIITPNQFIHASSKKGVIVNSLNEPYYSKNFVSFGSYR